MWPVDSSRLQLQHFLDPLPPYAILSHTWGDGEVTFQYFRAGLATESPGYEKILYSYQQAVFDKLEWVWVDTCCVDKTDNAALSEAINSMYRWCESARIC